MSGQAHASGEPQDVTDQFVTLTHRLLGEVVASFYETAGLKATMVGAEPTKVRRVELSRAASIGFVSDCVRGTLLIAPEGDLVRQSHPLAASGDVSADAERDWLGETANQLLGRLRNQLVAHHVDLLSDTPLFVSGTVRLGGIRRATSVLDFEVDGRPLRMWWDVQVDPELELKQGGEAAREEGELQLF